MTSKGIPADERLAFDEGRTDELMRTANDAENYLKQARSENTRRAYASDWGQFTKWIAAHGLDPLPADPRMVALWIAHMAGSLKRKRSTIKRMLATISVVHRRSGHSSPSEHEVVREEYRGICNSLAKLDEPQGRTARAAPLTISHLESVVQSMGDDLRARRDRALVLVGWSGALRRSELGALQVEDLAFMDKGVRARIRRSKTDQSGEGQFVGIFFAHRIALCPVRALQSWLEAAKLDGGPVFLQLTPHLKERRIVREPMTNDMIGYVLKRWTKEAGVQPEQLGDVFSSHSLRAGFITEAARAEKPEYAIAKQSRHKSAEVLRGYIRVASVFEGNAGDGLL